jgi:hypothetical protein
MCPKSKPGDKGMINGIEYESVDNELLRKRRDERVDMTKLCTSLVTDMGYLFQRSSFNQPIGNWDVSNVQKMQVMFYESDFNQPIGDWNVASVKDHPEYGFTGMFWGSQFNQNISNWCVKNIKSEPRFFSSGSPLANDNKPKWGTCPN